MAIFGRSIRLATTAVVVCALCAVPGRAQTRPERLRGVVTSADGAPVVAAAIVAVMAPDRTAFEARTDSAGRYDLHIAAGTGDYLLLRHPHRLHALPEAPADAHRRRLDLRHRCEARADRPAPRRRARASARSPSRPVMRRSVRKPEPPRRSPMPFQGAVTPDLAGDADQRRSRRRSLALRSWPAAHLRPRSRSPPQNSTTINGLAFDGARLSARRAKPTSGSR